MAKQPKAVRQPLKINIVLPYPPTVNTYWRHVGNHVLISAKGRAYKSTVASIVIAERLALHLPGELAVSIKLMVPDRRKRDIDNVLKSIFDSLGFAGVYLDDSQISELNIRKVGIEKPGRAEVTICGL